jgi:hypothetical protein
LEGAPAVRPTPTGTGPHRPFFARSSAPNRFSLKIARQIRTVRTVAEPHDEPHIAELILDELDQTAQFAGPLDVLNIGADAPLVRRPGYAKRN